MSRKGRVYQKVVGKGLPWHFVVDINPPGTARRQTRRGPFPNKRSAQEALNAELVRQQTGQSVQPDKVLFGDYLRHWLEAQHMRLKPSTILGYQRNIENYVLSRPAVAGVPIQSLTAAHLDALYADLRAGGALSGEPLSLMTIRRLHATLHKACRDAVRKRVLISNPAATADAPSAKLAEAEAPEMEVWTEEELGSFLNAIATDELWGPSFRLAAMSGMRRGEVFGQRWRDIDFEHSRLSVDQTLQPLGGALVFGDTKTTGSRRTIDLDARTMEVLRSHRARQGALRLALGPQWPDSDLVFRRVNGLPINPNNAAAAFKRTSLALGLPSIRFHNLRHTHATLLLKQGVPIKVVSERLGHASPAFTMAKYQHVLPGMQAAAAQGFADRIESSHGRSV